MGSPLKEEEGKGPLPRGTTDAIVGLIGSETGRDAIMVDVDFDLVVIGGGR